MTDTQSIAQKGPAQDLECWPFDSVPTPSGVKVSVMREETGMPDGPLGVHFRTQGQVSPACLARPAVVRGLALLARDWHTDRTR